MSGCDDKYPASIVEPDRCVLSIKNLALLCINVYEKLIEAMVHIVRD